MPSSSLSPFSRGRMLVNADTGRVDNEDAVAAGLLGNNGDMIDHSCSVSSSRRLSIEARVFRNIESRQVINAKQFL